MTRMLYHDDSYLKERQGKVARVDGTRVLLNETIFFPVTSTEPGDTGAISGHTVIDVRRDRSSDEVWHTVETTPSFGKGEVVNLSIDWDKRYKMMRLHSALHLLAGCFELLFRQRAVAGVVESDTSFLAFKDSIGDYVRDAIGQANDDIHDGLEIATYEDESRKGFRWCSIGDYSPIPCGGVHVRNTNELNSIVLREIHDDGKRLVIGVE